ncbi:MAG: hypothetical protein FWC32_00265 [Firmicutes bacterium]|nr:hypothetical protein [Bacillota bacterium]
MYGIIIREMKNWYFTNLKEVFDILGNTRHYNWLLSNYECIGCEPNKITFNEGYVWLTGDELVDMVTKHDIQFIWGIVAAYAKHITLDEVLKYPIADAQEYAGYYELPIPMQNPLAEIEVYPIDSSFLIITSKSQDVIAKFEKECPDSEDLAAYNRKRILQTGDE